MTLGENIKELRKINDITQEELGKKLNVSHKTVSSWEIDRTEPSIGMISKMASFFGCEISDLIGDVKHNNYYYLNEDTRKMAQMIKEDETLYALFDASKGATKEDLEITKNLLISLKNKEKRNQDD